MTIENGIHSLTPAGTTDAGSRSRILSDLESLIMDLKPEDGCPDTGFPSPFSAGMFDTCWRFDPIPAVLDDEHVTSDDEQRKVMPDERMELEGSGCFNVKDEFVDYDLEPYSECSNSGGVSYDEGGAYERGGSYEEMLTSARQRIERACAELCVSFDVTEWTTEQVQKWCTWVCRLFNISSDSSRLEQLGMNGSMLCSLSKADFEAHLPLIGEYLYAELELWKNVFCLFSPALTLDMSTIMTSCSSNSEHNAPIDSYIDLNASIRSLSSTASSESFSPNTTRPDNMTTTRPSLQLLPQCVLDASNNSPAFNYLSGNPPLSEIDLNRFADFSQDSDDLDGLSKYMNYSTTSSRTCSPYNSTSSSSSETTDDFRDQRYTSAFSTNSGRQSNHLWQFLKELLSQEYMYQNCIRWLDRSKGIFKIEDSSKVAKLWGQRKNRPAMNYDKLSRSIRQYYKKGIIKKTSQSKRLVYQFCPTYAL